MNITGILAAINAAEALANSPLIEAVERQLQRQQALVETGTKYALAASAVEKFIAPILAQQKEIEAAAARARTIYFPPEPREPEFAFLEPRVSAWYPAMNHHFERPEPELPERTIIRKEVKRRVGFADFNE